LPDFLGVGQPRTGTSWLDTVLRGHAGLPRDVKEVDFFVKNYSRGLDWYMDYFADCDPWLPAGEICPSYFGSVAARERIAEQVPQARIICTFRDPVQVMFSFWKLARRNAWTTSDFTSWTPDSWQTVSQSLRAWFDAFGRERVLTLVYDDLAANPQAYLDRVCDFIGIEPIRITGSAIATQHINSFSRQPRSAYLARKARKLRDRLQRGEHFRLIKMLTRAGVWRFCFDGGEKFPALDPAVEQPLRDRLRPQIEELEDLIGRDLSLWKNPPTDSAMPAAFSVISA
jgi:LPS sulfotransferase NodH